MTSYFIGRVIGSILGGAVYSKCNRYLILIVALTTNSSMFAAIPWCTTYEVMISAHVIHGISGGVMSVTLISIAASIWGASVRGRVYMNSFYAAFAVSGFLSPMVTSKFLVPTDVIRYDTSLNNSRITVNNISWKSSYYIPIQRNNLTDTDELNSSLYLAYLISAGLAFCSALPFAAIYLKTQNSSFKQQNKDELQFIGRLPTWTKILQLINVGVFAAVFISLDFTFSGYLTVFCVQHLQWKKTSGSMLTSVAFIALLSGRIGGAVLTHYLKPLTMLMISIGLCSVGFVGFLLSAVYLDHTGIWISVCVLGIPMGVVWPCLLSWINEKLIPLGGKIAAYVMIASFMGALFSPMLFGYMMEEISPLWFCFLSLGKTIVAIISVVFIVIYTRCQSRLESKQSND
ncbi:sodium-dependent glucose transporter 1-like [Argopecten irradians]|uniref:sodium-dependent glucose transporter 1-like n=1 Tax=Argopecten irradians TaxID=31199 RepID=UPI00371A46B8